MEKLKSFLFLIIGLMVLGLVGYWAVFTIEPGTVHVDKEKQKELEKKNEELAKEVEELKNELRLQNADEEKTGEVSTEPVKEPTKPAPTTPTTTSSTSKYQTLINELQKLIDDKVVMKEKSRGTRVGTIQNFLNIYNNTSKRVDNDYGKGTVADVTAFQKAEGLTADGQTGITTYQKMIDWLKKNS